jgi:hypothetical protein
LFLAQGDTVVETGIPVPERLPAFRRRVSRMAEEFRSVQIIVRLAAKLGGSRDGNLNGRVARLAPVLDWLFAEVESLGAERGAQTLFVYLPIETELRSDIPWREFARASFARSGYAFVDLTESIRELPETDARDLFIPRGAPAGGHYNALGHRWAAAQIATAIREIGVKEKTSRSD